MAQPPPSVALDLAEPGRAEAEARWGTPERVTIRVRDRIDDRWLMTLLIPSFGIAISHSTGLFSGLSTGHPAWWWGHAWFVGGAGLIYGANRTLLFAGRRHADWFSRPLARLVLLVTGIVFGTVPTTVVMLQGWHALSGVPLGDAFREVLLINIICVLFVTWLYEMLFLIRERVDDQVRAAELRAAQTRAEFAALRAQVQPHFLFNALNTLSALIETRPSDAQRFVEQLAQVYRSLLDTRGRTTVPLTEELELAYAYATLLDLRYGGAVTTEVRMPDNPHQWRIVPGAIQLLLENVIRHNRVDPDAPLPVVVDATSGALTVSHPLRPRPVSPGTGTGLANLDARSRAVTGRPIEIQAHERFRVTVPMVSVS
ncbi:MAG: histidine kinase [Myxococcota bacterium]